MIKLVVLILAISSTILAERPQWYPENSAEIEAKCMEKYSLGPEIMQNILNFRVVDTPALRSMLFCSAKGKNVFRPEVGFEIDRFDLGLQYKLRLKCDIEFIRDCFEKHKDDESPEALYFHVVQCVFDQADDKCFKLMPENEQGRIE